MPEGTAAFPDAQEPLLPLIAQGAGEAVNECVERYGPLLWSMARRMSPTRADAEDAVQEIFMHLWRSAGRFDPARGKERTFVALLARRRLIDRLRQHTVKGRIEVHAEEAEIEATITSVPEGVAVDAQLAAQVIDSLPEEKRNVLVMSLADGFSHSEIAERTGLPLGTVKSTVRRSLLLIRAELGLDADGALRRGAMP
jgi:RNA polymerase sigma-70 factor, ECF subfamily